MKRYLVLIWVSLTAGALADILPASNDGPQIWKYTFEKPSSDWVRPDFDDSAWESGPGMFGRLRKTTVPIRTEWTTKNIWLRRTFTLETVPAGAILRVFHDEDAEIWLNGVQAAVFKGSVKEYETASISDAALAALRSGKNTIAVHCRQTKGGQGIDVGLAAAAPIRAFSKKGRSIPGKPNIVIFLADDHGRSDSEVYGAKVVKTPTMRRLAEQGMVFDNAFIASPACGPSRAALFSGLMPARNGAEPNHTLPRPGTQIMVKRLQREGYEVVAFGKLAHGKKHPAMVGFDRWRDGRREQLAELVRNFLANRTSEKPLCLMVGDHRPHVPWTPDSIYDPVKVDLPEYFIDTKETREHRARYYTDVTGMDSLMGKVDQMAREYFGNDDYIFMYSADHGAQWPFGKWNLYDAGIRVPLIFRWPGKIKAGVRTDAMVSWIDIFPTLLDLVGGSCPKNIDGRSFAPVLLGKTDRHRNVIFATHTGDGKMNVYPIRAVRTQRWKYIRNLRPDCYHSNHSDILRKDGAGAYWDSWDAAAAQNPRAAAIVRKYYVRPAIEFYDIINDPDEQHNLAGNPEFSPLIKKMGAMLDDWMKKQGDRRLVHDQPYPVTGPHPHDLFRAKDGDSGRKKGGRKKDKRL